MEASELETQKAPSSLLLLSLCHVQLFVTPGTAARQAFLSCPFSCSLLKLMFIELMMPSNHLILCHPLLLLPSVFPSIRVFSNESSLHIRWPKIGGSASASVLKNEYTGLISFRINWFDLLAVQGTRKSLPQHHSFKSISSSVLSHFYGPTVASIHDYWKNHSFDYMDLFLGHRK